MRDNIIFGIAALSLVCFFIGVLLIDVSLKTAIPTMLISGLIYMWFCAANGYINNH